MPLYKYKAISQTGQAVESIITARSREEVLGVIKQNSQIPVFINEYVEGKDVKSISIFNKVKIKDIAVFCRQFFAMLNAGVTIINCLDIMRQQIENKKLRSVIGEVYEDVQKGSTFSEGMKKHDEVFPELLVNMIAVGEVSGNLDTIMDRMATHYEKENKINNKIKGAMIYPIVLLCLSTCIVVFLLTFVMPTYVGMFTGSGVKLPLPTRIVMGISDSIKSYWYIYLLVIAGGTYIIRRVLKIEGIRFALDNMKLHLPIVRGTTQKIITSRFSRTLSTLISSGIPLLQALEVVSKIVGNKVVQKGISMAKDEVRKGVSLSVPIKKLGIFPPMLTSMLNIGEESGSLDEILNRTANYYDDEVETALENMTKLMEPLMIILVALIVGAIVIAMLLPMFDMIKTVQF